MRLPSKSSGIALIVLGIVLVAGIGWDLLGTNQSPASNEDGHGLAQGEGTSHFQSVSIRNENGTVHFEARYLWSYAPKDMERNSNTTFRNVLLCAYDENGAVLASTNLGTFTMPEKIQNVSLQIDEKPAFILVDHPRFHEYPGLDLAVLRFRDNVIEKSGAGVTGLNDFLPFEYPRHNESGRCR